MKPQHWLIAIVLASALPHGARAQEPASPYDEPIETDRHDFTESPKTVGRGVVQWEGGFTYSYKDQDGEIEHGYAYPESLIRAGLTEGLELRLRFSYAELRTEKEGEAKSIDGGQDLNLGLKLVVTEQCCWQPESALIVRGTAPSGANAWSSDQVEIGLNYIYGWEFWDRWSIAASTGFDTNGAADFSLREPFAGSEDEFIVWHQSLALGVPLTPRSELYLEWFGLYSHAREDDFNRDVVNLGFDYLVTDDLILDARIGVGLSDDADDFFSGIGGAVRF